MSLARRLKPLALIPALAIGVVLFVVLVRNKQAPVHGQGLEQVRAVRFVPAQELAVTPKAVGYGYIEPGQTWDAVAEVGGKVVETHPRLKRGAILLKDELLLRIDPASPALARDQARAQVENIVAQLRELDQKETNTRENLAVEQESLSIARKEYERRRALARSGTISPSESDQQEQAYLAQKNKVQSQQNALDLIPAERSKLRASLDQARSKLEDAALTVGKTEIRAPFDCRVSAVNVEERQAVNQGQVLASADSMGLAEVLTRMPLTAMRHLVPRDMPMPFSREGKVDMDRIARMLDFTAVVRVRIGDHAVEWPARLSRVSEEVDPKTRTIGVYVAVDDPYLKIKPGERPPLLRNMYAEVEIGGRPLDPAVVVPRSAVHQGLVYVANADNRLERRGVEVDFTQDRLSVLKSGLQAGERVVVSDLVPAVDGMLLSPIEDEELLTRMRQEAGAFIVSEEAAQ